MSQMPGYLGNFPNAWVSGKFPKYLGFWEISQMPIFKKKCKCCRVMEVFYSLFKNLFLLILIIICVPILWL